MAPLVSVLMATYNRATFLSKSVESVLAQSMEDFELVISDNASTDETPEVVQHYQAKDARVRYFRNSVNVGPVPNFNLCYQRSDPSSKYVIILPSDDWWEPSLLSRLVEAGEKHPHVTLIHCDGYRTDLKGQIITRQSSLYTALPPSGEHRAVRELYQGCYFLAHGTLINRANQRRLYPDQEFYDPALKWCPDYDLWLQLMTRGAVAYYIREPLVYHRIHEGQMSSQHNLVPMLRDTVTSFREKLEGICPPELERFRREALRVRLTALGSELLLAGQRDEGKSMLEEAHKISGPRAGIDLEVARRIAALPLPPGLHPRIWRLAVTTSRAFKGTAKVTAAAR
jgi:glycosyltransferase involved in cell wall biosynthesis